MGGPVGYVTGGQIDSIYQNLFNRKADDEGRAYYETLLKDKSVADAIAIIGGSATGVDAEKVTPQEIAGEVIKAAYSDTLSRSVDEIDPEGLTYYLGQVLYEGLDPTRIDDIFADSPEAQQFEATLPGITDILKKNAAGGSYSVYTPPSVVTPPAVTGDTVVGGVGNDTKAIAAPPVSEYGYINDLYKTYFGRDASTEELASYAGIFGPSIEPNELRDFILGGVTSGEITQARADTLLGRLPSTQGETSTVGASPGLPAIPKPPTFLPDAAIAQGRVDPYFLRTAAAPIATDPITGQPVLQGPTSLIQGTTPVAPPVAGMAEGGDVEGGMAKATPAELGSKFDISEFVDEQGRLVSGYSRPIRDEYGVIVGYEDRPYEENVVFGEELRRRQAAAPLDSEQAMLDMLARQGRTGVNPMTGGLAGIQVGGPMMRNQPQYYSTIEAGRRYRGMAKGGLADIADDMSDMGRGEDTMLLHVSPEEVRGLDAVARSMMGTGLTINPYTGLPEADIFNEIGKLFKKVAKPLAKVLPFILPFTPLGPLAQGLISGLTTGLASGDAKKGLFAGLTSFGTANLAQGAQAAAQTGADAAAQAAGQTGTDAAVKAGADAAVKAGADATAQAAGQASANFSGALAGADAAAMAADGNLLRASPSFIDRATTAVADSFSKGLDISGIPGRAADTVKGIGNLAFNDAAGRQAAAEAAKAGMSVSPTTAATTTFVGTSGEAARDTELAAERENAALFAEKEDKEKRFRELAQRLQQQYPFEYAKGGLTSLARGGMTYMEAGGTTGPTGTPREVVGNGDGMSDSIPADIEGVQEARLADGEFVVPADVVADIGNGSSDAGSKKLYDMMDRIRMARHGTKKQPPEINAERLMPA